MKPKMHVGGLRKNRNDWKVLRKGTEKDGKGNILIAHLSKLTHKASFKIFKTLKKADKAVVLTKPSYLNNLTFLRFKNRTSFSSTFSDLSTILKLRILTVALFCHRWLFYQKHTKVSIKLFIRMTKWPQFFFFLENLYEAVSAVLSQN